MACSRIPGCLFAQYVHVRVQVSVVMSLALDLFMRLPVSEAEEHQEAYPVSDTLLGHHRLDHPETRCTFVLDVYTTISTGPTRRYSVFWNPDNTDRCRNGCNLSSVAYPLILAPNHEVRLNRITNDKWTLVLHDRKNATPRQDMMSATFNPVAKSFPL